MDRNYSLASSLANTLDLPIIDAAAQVWFFRTQSGLYYYDFCLNSFIALGWDFVSRELMVNENTSQDVKKELISKLYPKEQRPGLILGQLDTLYHKMQVNDLVVIPSEGGHSISIGTVGEILPSINRLTADEEYEKCTFKHMRSVTWLKRVDMYTDVYLARILRAQQTISNISAFSEMVYRHLHPCYMSNDVIHIMLQKTTGSDLNIQDNIKLQSCIMKTNDILAEYFNKPSETHAIKLKTAISSPGFLEILLPCIPVSAIAVTCIFKALIGKSKNEKGELATGMLAIISKANEVLNDRVQRRKVQAETKQIEANTQKTKAETKLIEANTQKTLAETKILYATTDISLTKNEIYQKVNLHELSVAAELAACCQEIKDAADRNGIRVDQKLELVV